MHWHKGKQKSTFYLKIMFKGILIHQMTHQKQISKPFQSTTNENHYAKWFINVCSAIYGQNYKTEINPNMP